VAACRSGHAWYRAPIIRFWVLLVRAVHDLRDSCSGLPRLDTSRLRATWLAGCADLLGLATFMHAAGISCSQRLGDLITGLEPADEAAAVRLLGAARQP
jgi:hypothetical protein